MPQTMQERMRDSAAWFDESPALAAVDLSLRSDVRLAESSRRQPR